MIESMMLSQLQLVQPLEKSCTSIMLMLLQWSTCLVGGQNKIVSKSNTQKEKHRFLSYNSTMSKSTYLVITPYATTRASWMRTLRIATAISTIRCDIIKQRPSQSRRVRWIWWQLFDVCDNSSEARFLYNFIEQRQHILQADVCICQVCGVDHGVSKQGGDSGAKKTPPFTFRCCFH